jgi:hypothetical protein
MSGTSKLFIEVYDCPRCGFDHTKVDIHKLDRPVHTSETTPPCTYWGMCPVELEPVMLAL